MKLVKFTKIDFKNFINNSHTTMGICQSSNSKLINANDDIPFFDFKDKTFMAKVVDVYDGDTCTVVFEYNNELVKYKVRCLGYDSPEMKPSKDLENREEYINKAINARNYFINRISDLNIEPSKHYQKKEIKELFNSKNKKLVKMKCHGLDKYGRILGEFIVKGKNINSEMISKNHGYKYNGGTKKK